MENRRFILIALIGVVCFFIYQAWQDDQARNKAPTAAVVAEQPPVDEVPAVGDVPAATAGGGAAKGGADSPGGPAPMAAQAAGNIVVDTDVYRLQISLAGGQIVQLRLLGYPENDRDGAPPIALLDTRPDYYFVMQSGLAGSERALAAHYERFAAAQREYRLAPGQDTLDVPLTLHGDGYSVTKTYRFHRGSYAVQMTQTLDNQSGRTLTASPYARFVSTKGVAGEEPRFVHTFAGVGFYEQKSGDSYRFRKVAFEDLEDEPLNAQQTGGWISILQHYFAAAIIPPATEAIRYSGRPAKDRGYVAEYVGPGVEVPPGEAHSFQTELFIGPKLQNVIGQVAPGLQLTLDYGLFKPLAEPLFWVLQWLHKHLGNWGWSIIVLTVMVKAAFYKLSEAQYRSMAKTRKFAPRIQDLKERYAGDPERMRRAMMELYKKEGFNPLAGCWPMLVQFPVFLALYWVLLQSVELRQAEFIGWIHDLTQPDPWYVLPVLYGISMWATQRLSGQFATMDPMQQKVMNVMPIAMTGFFAFFPSGLVLYWVVSNVIGIVQQWVITQRMEREGLGRNGKPA